ncbi:MAG TPA: tRNA guanosine(15) transglycosylase TgtA [Methanomicrobia archaeon]|nr:tRNA guanosine(15) transglycosylase TgtA [Methanomicrobia archaeon]
MLEFELRHKDLMGRIGRLQTPHGAVETPTILPVINPNIPTIAPRDMRKYGAEMLITNAYIIYRNAGLHEEAVKHGLHALLDCDLPVMTDSGSYQLYEYQDVEVSNRETLEFQQLIGSDVCVPLDIPTPTDALHAHAKSDLEETIRRLREARRIFQGTDQLLAGVVQGATFLDLREESAREAAALGFDLYAIGGVVPLLESYAFGTIANIIVAAKQQLPLDAPVHLFGAGHPIIFPLAVALGCDLFDSAAYVLYAKGRRYITADGTRKVDALQHLPCSCPVCSAYTIRELQEAVDLLAAHNLWVTFEEMRIVKQSIVERNLWELCERRCRAYPALLNGLLRMTSYAELIERYDPGTKHPFFYLSACSARRPEVLRYASRLNRFTVSGTVLITTASTPRNTTGAFDHVFFVKPPFGPYPVELAESYPVGQAELPQTVDDEARAVALQNVLKLLKLNREVKFVFWCDRAWEGQPLIDEIRKYAEVHVVE